MITVYTLVATGWYEHAASQWPRGAGRWTVERIALTSLLPDIHVQVADRARLNLPYRVAFRDVNRDLVCLSGEPHINPWMRSCLSREVCDSQTAGIIIGDGSTDDAIDWLRNGWLP